MFSVGLTHLRQKFKKCSDFYKTLYTLPKGREKNIYDIFLLYLVLFFEIWVVTIWQMQARTGTKLSHL